MEVNFRNVLHDIAVFNNRAVQNHQILIEGVKVVLIVINKAFGGIIKKIKEVGNLTVANFIENFRNSFEQLENNFNQRANFLAIEGHQIETRILSVIELTNNNFNLFLKKKFELLSISLSFISTLQKQF
jgi:hypothetical protein